VHYIPRFAQLRPVNQSIISVFVALCEKRLDALGVQELMPTGEQTGKVTMTSLTPAVFVHRLSERVSTFVPSVPIIHYFKTDIYLASDAVLCTVQSRVA
jgi:hypothetical protein